MWRFLLVGLLFAHPAEAQTAAADTVDLAVAAARTVRDPGTSGRVVLFREGLSDRAPEVAQKLSAAVRSFADARACRDKGESCAAFDRAKVILSIPTLRIRGDSAYVVVAVSDAMTEHPSYRTDRYAASRHQVYLVRRSNQWVVVRHTLESVF